ncbi:MAG: hypothetical protein V3T62_05090, partial [Alphaproteobacteria bacterium]
MAKKNNRTVSNTGQAAPRIQPTAICRNRSAFASIMVKGYWRHPLGKVKFAAIHSRPAIMWALSRQSGADTAARGLIILAADWRFLGAKKRRTGTCGWKT